MDSELEMEEIQKLNVEIFEEEGKAKSAEKELAKEQLKYRQERISVALEGLGRLIGGLTRGVEAERAARRADAESHRHVGWQGQGSIHLDSLV